MADTLFTDASGNVPGTVVVAAWLNDVDKNTYNTLTAVAGTNTITANGPLPLIAYTRGMKMWFLPAVTNTTAVTLNVNSLGSKAITKSGAVPLIAGDLVAATAALIFYDGVQWQLTNPQTIAVTGVVPITNGGTGGTTALAARNNLGIGSVFSFRNKLINGNGAINQRVYVSGVATGVANQYTLDRWRVVTSGQNLTFAANGAGNTMTAPAGGLEQVIEGNNIEGGVYTLSWTGTATATVNGSAVANGGQTASLPANTNVTVRFSSGTVFNAQLELGTITTTFEQRHFALELVLCKRYYFRFSTGTNGEFLGMGYFNSATQAFIPITFPQMRTTPTINAPAGSYSCFNASGGLAISSLVGTVPTDRNAVLICTVVGATSNTPCDLRATSAGGVLQADAEL